MKTKLHSLLLFSSTMFTAPALFAADTTPAATWRAQTLLSAIGNVLIFAAIGIAAAIIGFKVFDKCTPGNLEKEIIENKNVAAAIIAAAVILGVSLIIAASMVG
jgi:uncharacterized membrane protein YjfL (UPF0719 family)